MNLARPILLVLLAACASDRTPIADRSAQSNDGSGGDASATSATQLASAIASASPPAVASSEVDLGREQALVDESAAALQASDYSLARARAAEAVAALLSRNDAEDEERCLELLDAAARAASDAQDPRTANVGWTRVLEVRSRTLPDDHPDLQWARANLAVTIRMLGDLTGARALEEKVLEVRSRTLPDDNLDLQLARGNLAITMKKLGDLAGARALEERVLEVRSRTLPDDHADLQAARANLAITLDVLGDYAGARALKEKVLEVRSRTLPDDHPDLQSARGNLAATMYSLGDLPGARALQEKVLEVRARTLPDDHPDFQVARVNLASTMYELGDLPGARALSGRVLEVRSRTLPDDHPILQVARGNLAVTLARLGDRPGARALFEKVLEIHSRTLPDDHPRLQLARANLAVTIREFGDLAGARALEEKVLEVRSRTLSDDHLDLQLARGNLAVTMYALGDLMGARALQEKVLEIRTRTLPDEHPDLQLARQGLGITIEALGDFSGARELFEKVLEVRARTLPDDHPDLQVARGNLAWILARERVRSDRVSGEEGEKRDDREGERRRCAQLVAAMCRAQTSAARSALLGASSREAQARCEKLSESLSISLSFAGGLGVVDPFADLQNPCFVLSETTRGAAIGAASVMRLAASSPRYAELREELQKRSAELATLVQDGATSESFDEALARRESVEHELLSLAKELSGGTSSAVDLSVESFTGSLAEREALVAFRRYKRTSIEKPEDAPSDSNGRPSAPGVAIEKSVESLCAFVLRPMGEHEEPGVPAPSLFLVELGPIAPIENAVREWRAGLGSGSDARGVSAGMPTESSTSVVERGRELRRLVFDPLRMLVEGRDRVVVVLDDVLQLVPLDALPEEATGPAAGEPALLGERLRIETRVTLTELLDRSERDAAGRGDLVVVGGVAYGAPREKSSASPGADVSRREDARAGILRGGAWSEEFKELPRAWEEAREIAAEFERLRGEAGRSTLLGGAEATRERLIELAPRARWLHVATHGWFASESIRSWKDDEPLDKLSGLAMRESGAEQVKGMSPMLLCGLALAGANSPEDEFGRVPGLITAEEIAALDLSHCELAVLSACDTNVGERRAGQGVASMQQALQMAGARSVITSLWKVPDEATKELMLDFYRRLWVEKKPKHQALWEAKTKLREAKDERGDPEYTTRDWAAWVLTGNPD